MSPCLHSGLNQGNSGTIAKLICTSLNIGTHKHCFTCFYDSYITKLQLLRDVYVYLANHLFHICYAIFLKSWDYCPIGSCPRLRPITSIKYSNGGIGISCFCPSVLLVSLSQIFSRMHHLYQFSLSQLGSGKSLTDYTSIKSPCKDGITTHSFIYKSST